MVASPVAAVVAAGVTAERPMLIGCEDGYIRSREKWRNYTMTYAPMSDDEKHELVERMKRAMKNTKFIKPLVLP